MYLLLANNAVTFLYGVILGVLLDLSARPTTHETSSKEFAGVPSFNMKTHFSFVLYPYEYADYLLKTFVGIFTADVFFPIHLA